MRNTFDDRSAAEDERHDVEGKPSGPERPDDAGRADGAKRACDRRHDQAVGVESRQGALRAQAGDGDEHADEEIRDADAEQRLEGIAQRPSVPLEQERAVGPPRQHGSGAAKIAQVIRFLD